ncbi:MAG: hypothetical protein NTW86_17595 [Candidatus Sumerlaeota bacterium]|nr:hypothetical protein [Candidatus Sumerlaeota bacterium]
MPELLTYKRILVETAKDEWRRKHPDRSNLPARFEESVRLGFSRVQEGSAVIPVERIVELGDDSFNMYVPDEVDDAAQIIEGTIRAAERDEPYPENLSARIIPMFGEWGKTLRPGEAIELGAPAATERVRFTPEIRERLLQGAGRPYEDRVVLTGEVRSASLRTTEGGVFSICLETGETVEGVFTSEQESRVTSALHQHTTVRLRLEGVAEFSGDGRIRRIHRVSHLEELAIGEERFDPEAPPIWEVIAELGASVSEEEWSGIPSDASVNLDHYLYGAPKASV